MEGERERANRQSVLNCRLVAATGTSAAGYARWMRLARTFAIALACAPLLVAGGCDLLDRRPAARTPAQVQADLARLLPATLPDRAGWARDIQVAFTALDLPPSTPNLCAALAVIEQESGYKADPPVPGLGRIAREEIERRAGRYGIPKIAVAGLLQLQASDGRRYADKLAAVRTERELSNLFEELLQRAPALTRRWLARANPVRTGGPMQVSMDYAEAFVRQRDYPYAIDGSLRSEVFSRRGGLYFGIAHLLKYPTSYPRHLYRFADFNAGHYASRNAAFQQAVSRATGIELVPDGDLVRGDGETSATHAALLQLDGELQLGPEAIRRDLRQSRRQAFEQTALYRGVYAAAERRAGTPLPRAAIPRIALESPKITRRLTTRWFAERVEARYRACERRATR